MKYITEYRDAKLVKGVIEEIRRTVTRPWTLMEICGGQTHAIVRHEIDQLSDESPLCIAGSILQGLQKPHDCSAFGRECTPENPLGATMVSSEGACAAYYKYGR